MFMLNTISLQMFQIKVKISSRVFSDQVYSNTRVSTQVNTSQHESTRVNMSPTQVNTNQHASDTSRHKSDTSQHESTRV